MWSLHGKPLTLSGHEHTVNTVAFHPLGKHLLSASHDMTWGLWDVETQAQLLSQEGHSGPVYALDAHPDGSLVASGDLHGVVLLWDLRSGKSLLSMDNPNKSVTKLGFMQSGYHIALSGDSNCISFYDLRKKEQLTVLAAHNKTVSDFCFEKHTAQERLLYSSSYDGSVRIFGTRCIINGENTADDWVALRTLASHENKVTSLCVSRDSRLIISASFDRCFKVWKC